MIRRSLAGARRRARVPRGSGNLFDIRTVPLLGNAAENENSTKKNFLRSHQHGNDQGLYANGMMNNATSQFSHAAFVATKIDTIISDAHTESIPPLGSFRDAAIFGGGAVTCSAGRD